VPRPDGGWLAAQLAPAGIPPERIGVVVLTHAHIDHIGGMIERGRLLFPNARVVVGETEHRFWSDDARLAAARDSLEYRTAALFRANVLPLARRTALVNPGDEVVPGIRAVEAHGHTPGHLAFHVESAGRQLLVWGDCAHHEVASLAHPEWHALFDMDKDASARTRRRMYELAAAERLPVVGYHTSFPSVGFVERDGRTYRWLPATYQLRV
jgi:glyoxylase-like metal-dependent hydrolase (beta-lactamase superfamily II)